MNLIQFKGGSDGVPVWISVDAVASVQADTDPGSKLTLITTQDGKEHRVQEPAQAVVDLIQSSSGS
jgi:hypothetical protein